MKRHGLITGASRSDSAGYTLLEVLLAVAILAVAFTFLFPALFRSADHLKYLSQRFTAKAILENKIVDATLHFKNRLSFEDWPEEGQGDYFGFQYNYKITIKTIDPAETLQDLQVKIEWGSEHKSVTGHAYVSQ